MIAPTIQQPPSIIRVTDTAAHICAWCDVDDAGGKWAGERCLIASHGICEVCRVKLLIPKP